MQIHQHRKQHLVRTCIADNHVTTIFEDMSLLLAEDYERNRTHVETSCMAKDVLGKVQETKRSVVTEDCTNMGSHLFAGQIRGIKCVCIPSLKRHP